MKYRSLYNDNVIETQKIRYTNCYYCGKRVELLRAGIEKKSKHGDVLYLCEIHKRIKIHKIKLRKR